MWFRRYDSFTVGPKHGLGVLFNNKEGDGRSVFYEDCIVPESADDQLYERLLHFIPGYADPRRVYMKKNEMAEYDRLVRDAEFTFIPKGKGKIDIRIEAGARKIRVSFGLGKSGYGFNCSCECGRPSCLHISVAALGCVREEDRLISEYVVSGLPVNKGAILDHGLINMIGDCSFDMLSKENIGKIRAFTERLDRPASEDYYLLFHEFLLDMHPYFSYDAHFLEEYAYLLFALFEDKGYSDAVIRPGDYAEPTLYEERQHRSNRTAFKRVLKEYQTVLKKMEQGKDSQQSYYQEFLLKYREDFPGLLRYYALIKLKLDDTDLPYLMDIAALPEFNTGYLLPLALKLDRMSDSGKSGEVLAGLTERLSSEEKTVIYGCLHELSMPAEEILKLDLESQKKMIYNTPLTAGTLKHIMSDVLKDESASVKGRFLVHAGGKSRLSRDTKLKKAIIDHALELPDNRILIYYLTGALSVKAGLPEKGDQRRELTEYFNCEYEVIDQNDTYRVEYSIVTEDPKEAFVLFANEQDGRLSSRSLPEMPDITPDLLKEVCISGREDEFRSDMEKIREKVNFYNFEKEHRLFIREYNLLCDSLGQEKVVLAESRKAGLEYLFYRKGGKNSLALKVGNTKKYIVKDASGFIHSFKKGTTEKYGRDLILTHDPDNLEAEDAAVMRLLMGARYSVGSYEEPKNKRYISINDSLMGSLLEHLEGRMTFFNESPCLIRLEKKPLRVQVDKDYRLSVNLGQGQEYFNLDGRGYLLSPGKGEADSVIDRLDGSKEEAELFELVTRNPQIGIRPILPDFRKKVYARFFDLFDVDQKIKHDFRVSELKLNSYFDYHDASITVRTDILRDDKVILPEQVTDRIDRVRVEQLGEYLASIGFEDGVMEDESRVLSFFKMDFSRLKMLTNVYLSDTLKKKELLSVGKPVIRVTYSNDMMSAFLEKSDFTKEELAKIISGLRKKKKFILLDGDRIVDLDSETAKDLGETVSDFGLDPKDLYKKKTISMVTAIKAFAHERSCRVDRYLRDMIEEIRGFKQADIDTPKLNGELREYQAEGYRWMSILSKYHMGGILADDMGLGKTIQIIALIKADKTRKPSLVVCPKSLIFNWRSEFARFDPKTGVTVIYGTDAERSRRIAEIDYGKKAVYVTSYESLRNDISKYTGEFNYGILDEAQFIKNVHAQKTKSVKELRADHRFALTGTPVENSVVDLWSIFDYIMPGYFDELSEFKSLDTKIIAGKAAPFILRRVKTDVLEDLPPKYERILSAEMTDDQRKLYDAMRMEARERLQKGGKAFDMLPYLTRLRQVCVDPAMFVEGYKGGSGKLELIREMIPEYLKDGHRVLIFSAFVRALKSVEKCLSGLGIECYFLSGSTPAADRIEMMESFNSGSGADVFLISLKAGGTGLNLTGADTVLHLDPWWNVAAEDQASDRAHRIGQQRNVEVIRLIADSSIEQRVVELQEIKKAVIREVISDDDGSVVSASLEDIAYILEDEREE